MGFNFFLQAVAVRPDGSLEDLAGEHTIFSIRSNSLFKLVDAVNKELNWRKKTPLAKRFPWYQNCQGPDGIERVASGCFKPKEVLETLQLIEREEHRAFLFLGH